MDRTAYIREHEETGIRLYTTATWCEGAVLIGPNKGVAIWLDFDGPDCLQHGTNEEIGLYTTATWCLESTYVNHLIGVGIWLDFDTAWNK